MAGGLPALDDEDQFEPMAVDHTAPAATVIRIDGGQIAIEGEDGSLTIPGPAVKRQRDTGEGFDANLALDSDLPMASIAENLIEGIEADIASRKEWEDTANRGREMLGVKLEEASSSVSAEGTISQIRSLGMLEAVLASWANARAELLPASGPVKVKDDLPPLERPQRQPGEPLPPSRSELAEALETDMNHYLTVKDKEYVPDFSRMLLNRALNGVQFRKVYFCPLRRRPVSVWVPGADLIVSDATSHLSGAGRVTERFKMRQALVKRLQKQGHWRDVPLVQPTENATPTERTIGEIQGTQPVPQLPADHRHEIYECYCELDQGGLDEDENGKVIGWPLPYRVTIDKESRTVLEIRRNWKQGDEDFVARRRYIKYGFVPGFGFYDWGLVHILGNPQRALTAIERLLIDAGMYKSMPGGLMAKGPGTRQRTNQITPAPGEFAVIDTGGLPIQQVAMPFPYGEPSAVLQNMGVQIGADMRRISGVLNLPVGEGRAANVPVGTMLAYVDSITKVPSAIHKDDHAAQQEEFELLKELFEEDPEALTKGVKNPARKVYTAEELADQDLVPAADPNVPSQVHRFMQTTALTEAAALPIFQGIADPRGIWERVVKILGVEDIQAVTLPPQPAAPPPPDPKIVAAGMKLQGDTAKANASMAKVQADAETKNTELTLQAIEGENDRQSEEQRAAMHLAGEVAKSKAHIGSAALDTLQGHAQHINELNQADRHHQDDLAQAAQNAIPTPANGE